MSEQYDIVIDELDDSTCWRLLARAGFGRVGFLRGEDLVVLPVNAGVVNDRVVFRTAADTSLARAGNGSIVALKPTTPTVSPNQVGASSSVVGSGTYPTGPRWRRGTSSPYTLGRLLRETAG